MKFKFKNRKTTIFSVSFLIILAILVIIYYPGQESDTFKDKVKMSPIVSLSNLPIDNTGSNYDFSSNDLYNSNKLQAGMSKASAESGEADAASQQVMLRKYADLKIKVEDVDTTASKIKEIVKQYDAYISFEKLNNKEGDKHIDYYLRVPYFNFEKLVNKLSLISIDLEKKEIKIEDVTDQYIDIKARLKNKRILEETYSKILKSAKKVEDILDIQEKINEIREEIESTEKRLEFLSTSVKYSSVSLEVYSKTPEVINASPGWSDNIAESFYTGWSALEKSLFSLVTVWPLMILGGIGFVIYRLKMKKKGEIAKKT